MPVLMRILGYIVGFGAAVASIIVGIANFASHQPVHNSLPLIVFGVPMLLAMILLFAWNKKGVLSAGAGEADTGLSASFDLDDGQWVIFLIIVVAGVIGAVVTGTAIHS
jgi:hypothetical protein